MAVPVVINLKPLKNQYRDGIFTPETPSQVTGIAVDTDAQKTLGAVHKEDFFKLIYEMVNNGANPADFFYYGAAVDDDSHGTEKPPLPPPDELSNEWMALPNGIITVAANGNDGRIITDNWTWIMIRIARTNTGQDTTIDLRIRGV